MSKHTDGPWTYANWVGKPELCISNPTNGDWVADVVLGEGCSPRQQEANAALIAECPTMYELCRLLAERDDSDDPLVRDATALMLRLQK